MEGTMTQTSLSEDTLKRLEKMMINISHMTGQHYGQEYWKGIVKAGCLDIYIFFDRLFEKSIISATKQGRDEERERMKQIMQRKYCGELMEEDVDPPQKENHI